MTALRYKAPGGGATSFALIASEGEPAEERFPFDTRIEIGRFEPNAPGYEGRLLVDDVTISSLHCVIVRDPDGRLYARDSSRNGTWVDGVRLIPNREQEIRPGQMLSVGRHTKLRLFREADPPNHEVASPATSRSTLVQPSTQDLAVLVGDVRGYTSLLAAVPGPALQTAVAGVFTRLARTILSLGGQVKEYQGDSIMAFWESAGTSSPAIAACRAALALQRDVALLAADRECWPFVERPLQMDWAVATGRVSAQVLGRDRPEELSLVGEPVVLAYRLEKAANDQVGALLTCARTRAEATGWFEFRDAGTLTLAGFAAPVAAFQLLGEARGPAGATAAMVRRPPP